jgi:predicted nucleic acid-binding protein
VRIFLDANILFSAAGSAGAVRRFVLLLLDAGHDLCVDAYVVEEARRNLAVKRQGGEAALAGLLKRMKTVPARPHVAALDALTVLPEKDRPVLAAAIQARCDALVTGDIAHFGPLYGKAVHGVKIHSPQSLYRALFG